MSDFLDRLNLLITADATGAANVVKGFGSTATSELSKVEGAAATSGGKAGSLFNQAFSGQTALLVSGLSATLGTVGAGLFAKSAVGDAVELARANAQLAATLTSTGSAAGVTVEQVDRLADSIQKTDAIYAGNVKQAAALVAANTAIQNSEGAGNDIFDRTVSAAASLANVFGKDLSQSAIQLGRALENPASGLQSLSRSGVSFSAATREQILALAKQGDILGAQKVILTDLEQRYTAAGAAIAKADPFQQFGVAAKEFKTEIGNDLLPAVTTMLHFADDILGGFGALPAPIRATAEALGVVALSAIPLLKVKSVLDSLKASSSSNITNAGGAAASTGVTAATEAEAAATTEAAAAHAELNTQLALFSTELGVADGQLSLFTAVESEANVQLQLFAGNVGIATAASTELTAAVTEEAAAQEAAATTGGGLAGALGVIGPVAAGAAAGLFLVGKLTEPTKKTFQELTSDSGALAKELDKFQKSSFGSRLFDVSGARQDAADVGVLNDALIKILDTEGVAAASAAYSKFLNNFSDVSAANAATASLAPFHDALVNAIDAEQKASANTTDLNESFDALAGSLDAASDKLDIADSFDKIATAQAKVNADKADIAGTSKTARDANNAEANALRGVADANQNVTDSHLKLSDSYVSLLDAQDKVKTSTHSLLEAQQALDLFNSPRGAKERALQLDALQRRVVTTPAESDNKQLDLLQLQDTNNQKKQSLQDALTNAQRGYRDALKGVTDAQRGIVDAEKNERDAVLKVVDANVAVTDAVEKRKKVHDDAAKAIAGDERQVQEDLFKTISLIDQAAKKDELQNSEIENWTKKLDGLAGKYAAGSDLFKAVDGYYKMIEGHQKKTGDTATQPHNSFETPKQATENQGALPENRQPQKPEPGIPYSAPPSYAGGYADGGMIPGLPGTPKLITAHAGEVVLNPAQQKQWGGGVTIHQTNHFGSGGSSPADLEYANRQLGWKLARAGRN